MTDPDLSVGSPSDIGGDEFRDAERLASIRRWIALERERGAGAETDWQFLMRMIDDRDAQLRAYREMHGHQALPSPLRHQYRAHRKYPWFCADCGYPEHERLKHLQPGETALLLGKAAP